MSSTSFNRAVWSYGAIGLGYAAIAPRLFPICQRTAILQATAFLVAPIFTKIASAFSLPKDTMTSCVHGLISFVAMDFASRYIMPIPWTDKYIGAACLTVVQWVISRLWCGEGKKVAQANPAAATARVEKETPGSSGKYYVVPGSRWQRRDSFDTFLEHLRKATQLDFVVAEECKDLERGAQVMIIDYWERPAGELGIYQNTRKQYDTHTFTYVIVHSSTQKMGLPSAYNGAKVVGLQYDPDSPTHDPATIENTEALKNALGVHNPTSIVAPVRERTSNSSGKYYVVQLGLWRPEAFKDFLETLRKTTKMDFVVVENGKSLGINEHVVGIDFWGSKKREGSIQEGYLSIKKQCPQSLFTYVLVFSGLDTDNITMPSSNGEYDASKTVLLRYKPGSSDIENTEALKEALGVEPTHIS